MTVPFMDLKLQYAAIRGEILPAIADVLESAHFVLGKEVSAFEREFADFCGVQHSIAVNSGTSALHLALLAAGVGPGDEVITVPCTFVATVAAILYTGAKPIFVDVDPHTYTMDPTQIEGKLTPKTKAIVPVHLYGHPADMDPILAIARRSQPDCHRRRMSGARSRVQRPEVRFSRRSGMLQSLSGKNSVRTEKVGW